MAVSLFSAADKSTCRYCDSRVSKDFRRTFGDDDDRAHRCSECDTYARLTRGSAAGLDVNVPDPETSPGRHGGEPA